MTDTPKRRSHKTYGIPTFIEDWQGYPISTHADIAGANPVVPAIAKAAHVFT